MILEVLDKVREKGIEIKKEELKFIQTAFFGVQKILKILQKNLQELSIEVVS